MQYSSAMFAGRVSVPPVEFVALARAPDAKVAVDPVPLERLIEYCSTFVNECVCAFRSSCCFDANVPL